MAQPCSVDACDAPTVGRGWCRYHWGRWRRTGDPLGHTPRKGTPTDFDDGTRICNDCQQRKPLEDFPRDKSATKGRRSHCKVCHVAKEMVRYNGNPERFKAKQRQHRLDNLDEIRRKEAERYERDKVKRVAYAVEQVHRRRVLLAQVEHTPGITIRRLRLRHGDTCCYCRVVMDFAPGNGRDFRPDKATLEHVIPLTRGGGHTWDNTRLACWRCNVRKNAKLVTEWSPDRVLEALGQLTLFDLTG